MSTITKGLTVDLYDKMVNSGVLPENRFELIEGKLVEKVTKRPSHSVVAGLCLDVIQALLPSGWHIRPEQACALKTTHPQVATTGDSTVSRG